MELFRSLTVVVLCLMTSLSCTKFQDPKSGLLITISGYDAPCLENGELLEFETVNVIELEQTDESIIDFIKRVECVDSIVLVQTSSSLFAFHQNGKYLCTYGNMGVGPEEYLSLSSFVVDKTDKFITVKIVDEGSSKILEFDLEGKFISAASCDRKKLSLWTVSGIQLNTDEIVFTNMMYNDMNTLYSLFDEKKVSLLSLFKFPVRTKNTVQPFGKTTLSFYHDTVKLIQPFDAQIYELRGVELLPIMKVQTKQKQIKAKQIKTIDDFSINTYADFSNQKLFTGFTGIYETNDYILLEVLYSTSYFLIQKGSSRGTLYDYSLPEELKEMPLINIKSADSTYFVGVIDPMQFFSTKEKINPNTNDSSLLNLRNTLDGLTIDSNPCLVYYRIK